MGGRVLLLVAALALLYGCGQASSPPERQEKQEGAEQVAEAGRSESASPEPTTERAVGNIPASGVVGENVEADTYDIRVLDYFTTDRYFYRTDVYLDDVQDAIPTAGKFVVVSYSVTNTGAQAVGPNLMADLHTTAPDGGTEVYAQTDLVSPPNRLSSELYLEDIAPRQMLVSQFIFDVPTDVEPQLLAVKEEPTIDRSFEVGAVDLRGADPQGPGPEEAFGLLMEYANMAEYERAYALFAQESKDRVSEQTYVTKNERDDDQEPVSFTGYSFPSVEEEGDRATMQIVRSYSYEEQGDGQERITQEAVLEEEGWRIVMRPEQYENYLGE